MHPTTCPYLNLLKGYYREEGICKQNSHSCYIRQAYEHCEIYLFAMDDIANKQYKEKVKED